VELARWFGFRLLCFRTPRGTVSGRYQVLCGELEPKLVVRCGGPISRLVAPPFPGWAVPHEERLRHCQLRCNTCASQEEMRLG
jgi:hypothetical protein